MRLRFNASSYPFREPSGLKIRLTSQTNYCRHRQIWRQSRVVLDNKPKVFQDRYPFLLTCKGTGDGCGFGRGLLPKGEVNGIC